MFTSPHVQAGQHMRCPEAPHKSGHHFCSHPSIIPSFRAVLQARTVWSWTRGTGSLQASLAAITTSGYLKVPYSSPSLTQKEKLWNTHWSGRCPFHQGLPLIPALLVTAGRLVITTLMRSKVRAR